MEQESKSSSVEQESGNKEEAFTHLAQGKRHLLVKDYNEAATSLGMACTLLSKLYGEFANECGEAYFNYGKALLELARSENDVLEIDGEREESQDSEEDEGDEEEGNDAGSETKNVENGKGGDEQAKDPETENNECEANGTKGDDAESKEKDTEGEEEEDVDNLHLAWEMLEMAKIVFKKQAEENKKINLKLAEVHLKLGEIGLESENYSQGIEDIKFCLKIQLENLEKHDRYIAETHYQLGVAYTLNNEFDNAIEQYNQALKLLEARIEYLLEREKQGVTSHDKDDNNPFYSVKEEIAEINAILPEVKEKISDVEDLKKETKNALIAGIGAKSENASTTDQGQSKSAGTESSSFPFSSSSSSDAKPVSDISHLVRKKRKLETDPSEEKSTKQPCPDVSKPE